MISIIPPILQMEKPRSRGYGGQCRARVGAPPAPAVRGEGMGWSRTVEGTIPEVWAGWTQGGAGASTGGAYTLMGGLVLSGFAVL